MIDMFTRVSALEAFANHMQLTADNLGNRASNYRVRPSNDPSGPGDRTVEFTTPYGTYNRDVPPPAQRALAHDKNVSWEHTDNLTDVPVELNRALSGQPDLAAEATAMRPFEAVSGGLVDVTA